MSIAELREMTRARKRSGTGSRSRVRLPDNKAALLFLAPFLLGAVLLTLGPMLGSLYLSFTNYNLLQDPAWVGVDNYARMLTDERLHKALSVTFLYVAVGVPLQLCAALGLAMILDRGMRALPFYRAAFYLPSLLGSSVAIAILWRLIFGADGLFNKFLGIFGVESNTSWIGNPDTSLVTIILLHVWTFGSPMVIFLAGLRQIPAELYEAAATDGAQGWQRFRAITLPLLTPIIFFNLVLAVINSFSTFTQAFVVSGGSGGPADSLLFYTLYLYQEGFASFRMGYASALAWLLLIIIGVATAINFWLSKYWVHYDD